METIIVTFLVGIPLLIVVLFSILMIVALINDIIEEVKNKNK